MMAFSFHNQYIYSVTDTNDIPAFKEQVPGYEIKTDDQNYEKCAIYVSCNNRKRIV